jgi:drug/metabolite transporter (DMT)-like permease
MNKHPFYGIGLALIGVLIISPDTLFLLWGDMPAFEMIAWRGLLAGACYFLLWYITSRSSLTSDLLTLKSKWSISIIACYFINGILFCVGIAIAPVPVVLFCVATAPIFAAIFSEIILKEPTRKSTWIAIIMVLIGISIAIFGSGPDSNLVYIDMYTVIGAFCGLGAAMTIAIGYVIIRHKTQLPFVLPMSIGVFLSGVVGLFITGFQNMLNGNILPIIFTGIFILPFPMYLLSLASRYTKATNVSLILLLESVLGPIWIWLGIGDQPTNLTIFGGMIVILSMIAYLIISEKQELKMKQNN